MMRNSVIVFLLGLLIALSSCRKDFEFEPSQGNLRFSKDTVYLDTVFSNIGSSTYTLKVYNRGDNDILIPSIKLGKADSKYRMTVDGMTGNDEDGNGVGDGRFFPNVELLAKDSLFIFIETTANIADANPTDFLYTDQIQFDGGPNLQTVELVTLIQDAVFLYPQRFDDGTTETLPTGGDPLPGFFLEDSELTFTNEKPYVIYGFAAVGSGKVLNIEPGARIHCHFESGIIVGQGGKINAQGLVSTTDAMENEIIFEGDRLEPLFSDIPGQWFGIWMTSGSLGSTFDHVTIKNAQAGMIIQENTETISIKNTQIYDSSNYGILAQTGKIVGENIVLNTAGQFGLACTSGGSYDFTHCTFNNNWASSSQLAVLVNNFSTDEDGINTPVDLVQANFTNCIIYGSNQTEMVLDKIDGALFNYNFTKNLIKFSTTSQTYVNDPTKYSFIIDVNQTKRSEDPDFHDIAKNNLNIGNDSAANGFGIVTGVTTDLNNTLRNSDGEIDLGAYEHTEIIEN